MLIKLCLESNVIYAFLVVVLSRATHSRCLLEHLRQVSSKNLARLLRCKYEVLILEVIFSCELFRQLDLIKVQDLERKWEFNTFHESLP